MKTAGFFAYFPIPADIRRWEVHATSFGYVRMPEKAPSYPPDRHPAGHHFVWEDGRVLADCQLLCIHAGRGEFESALTRRTRIQAGTNLILHPGVWHRYRPDPGTGWTESWIELGGAQVDRMLKNGLLDPRRSVFHRPRDRDLEAAWERARQIGWAKPPRFPVRLGLIALDILLLLQQKPRPPRAPRRIEDIVSRAQTLLSEPDATASTIEEMAGRLGVGYSHFRRAFKSQTGFSPKQYHNEVRFRRTKELLSNTTLSIKEIASRLGYSSPFHLTRDFTQRMRIAPSLWREGAKR